MLILKLRPLMIQTSMTRKGVYGGPSGPSREGPGIGHESVGHKTDDKRERKKEKKISGKREKCIKKKKIEEREREKWTEINGKR